jgi:hypothetical protein
MPFEVQNSIVKDPNIISSAFYFILFTKPYRILPDLGWKTGVGGWGPVVN